MRLLLLLFLLAPPVLAQEEKPDVGPEVEGRRDKRRASGLGDRIKDAPIPPGSWRLWWEWNRMALLTPQTVGENPPVKEDADNVVLPALVETLQRVDEDKAVRAAALLALGRAGTYEYIGMFADAAADDLTNDDDAAIELDETGTGRALLALGLLRDLDDVGREGARTALLDVIASSEQSTRNRAWAAIALGLRKDGDAVQPLAKILHDGTPNETVSSAILLALGMSGDPYVRELLEGVALDGKFRGRGATQAERAVAGIALARLGHMRSLAPVLKAIPNKRIKPVVKASLIVATGEIARTAEPARKEKVVDVLRKFMRLSGGQKLNEGLACLALGAIATEEAAKALLTLAERGKAHQRPFAAIAAGLCAGRGTLEPALRNRITSTLARLGRRFKDAESRASILLARGLARDRTAVPDLLEVVGGGGDPLVRGYACEALGLIGDASENVSGALLGALREKGSEDVRRRAAAALGLLRDKKVTRLLLHELATSTGTTQLAAAEALGQHGDRTALTHLAEVLGSPKRYGARTRAAAARALGRIINEAPALNQLGRNFNYRSSVAELNELLEIL